MRDGIRKLERCRSGVIYCVDAVYINAGPVNLSILLSPDSSMYAKKPCAMGFPMSKSSKSDPTKDPQFQNVVRHFLKTPHKPHKEKAPGPAKAPATPPSGTSPKRPKASGPKSKDFGSAPLCTQRLSAGRSRSTTSSLRCKDSASGHGIRHTKPSPESDLVPPQASLGLHRLAYVTGQSRSDHM